MSSNALPDGAWFWAMIWQTSLARLKS